MRKIRLKPTESYCQKYLYTKIMTSKCKIIKYKLNANIFFQIYFCSTFSVRIQKVKINWKGRRLFERRHSKNTIWCESTRYSIQCTIYSICSDVNFDFLTKLFLSGFRMNFDKFDWSTSLNFATFLIDIFTPIHTHTVWHTHTVCVPYYKAAPYNISHTKIFLMAIFTLIFFYKFFFMYVYHAWKIGSILACTDIW